MLLLLPLPFVALGCISFLFCATIPLARGFALATSLWFAAWGIIFTAALTALLLLFVGVDYIKRSTSLTQMSGIHGLAAGISQHGLLLIITISMLAAALAFGLAVLHGVVIRRMTFFLFRIYLAAVAFGVGLLAATPATFWLYGRLHLSTPALFALTLPTIPILAGLLAWFCSAHAQDFRGKRPGALNPVSPEEYTAQSGTRFA
jgi:hypothetical protein